MRAQYHRHDLLAALERAVTYGAYSYAAVERILSVQAEPKTTLETLADQEQEHLRTLLDGSSVPSAEHGRIPETFIRGAA